jgi:hypothetical protein
MDTTRVVLRADEHQEKMGFIDRILLTGNTDRDLKNVGISRGAHLEIGIGNKRVGIEINRGMINIKRHQLEVSAETVEGDLIQSTTRLHAVDELNKTQTALGAEPNI